MGEILKAYQTLNKVLNLGLTKDQFLVAEAQFKLDFADRVKFPTALQKDPMRLSAEWEVTATLTPRRTALKSTTRQSLAQLTTAAQKQTATAVKLATPRIATTAVKSSKAAAAVKTSKKTK